MKKLLFYTQLLLFFIITDQFSKFLLIDYLKTVSSNQLKILPFLKLVYVWNQGISFGLFGKFQYSNITIMIFNSLIVLYLTYQTLISRDPTNRFAIILIISGAIGNLIDRLIHGAVFDFIFLHCSNYSFPAFNLADSYITIGVMTYILYNLFYKK